jgi:hypothetical protein
MTAHLLIGLFFLAAGGLSIWVAVLLRRKGR